MRAIVRILACATYLFVIASCRSGNFSDTDCTVTGNPAAFLKTDEQKSMLNSLRDVADGHLYSIDYSADYLLSELMENGGAKSSEQLMAKVFGMMLSLPERGAVSQGEFGCSGFCVKSPDGDVLVGRNFDYKFNSAANLLVRDLASDGHASIGIAALPFLNDELYKAGALSDGTTDLSIPAVSSVYCCMDGMNDQGLFIAVLSLRDGGSVQHDTAKANIIPSLAIRIILDRCSSTDQALDVFRNHNFFADGDNPTRNYHFLIADAGGKSAVVEYYRPGEEIPVAYPGAKDWTMNILDTDHVTNFYLTEGWQNIGVGHDRYDIIHATLEFRNRVMTESECMELLKAVHTDLNPAEVTSNTQWSVVYNLTKKTASVCVNKDYATLCHFSL